MNKITAMVQAGTMHGYSDNELVARPGSNLGPFQPIYFIIQERDRPIASTCTSIPMCSSWCSDCSARASPDCRPPIRSTSIRA